MYERNSLEKRSNSSSSDTGIKVIVIVRKEVKYLTPLCNVRLKLSQAESSSSLNERR